MTFGRHATATPGHAEAGHFLGISDLLRAFNVASQSYIWFHNIIAAREIAVHGRECPLMAGCRCRRPKGRYSAGVCASATVPHIRHMEFVFLGRCKRASSLTSVLCVAAFLGAYCGAVLYEPPKARSEAVSWLPEPFLRDLGEQ